MDWETRLVHNQCRRGGTLKRTLEIINKMKTERIIDGYAIGGAVGATFYLEPSATLDIDVFILLTHSSSSALVNLTPIYEYLHSLGYRAEHEHVVIEDWPVQFLPAADELQKEAITEAQETQVEGIITHVASPEHLIAIALKTGRAKDYGRILQFLESGVYDSRKLDSVLNRHRLLPQWERFKARFLGEING